MGGISGGGRGAMRKMVRRIIGGVLILGLGLVGWRILSSRLSSPVAWAHDCPPPNCEDRHNLYVPGAGYVANAWTYGYWFGGVLEGWGSSSSSRALYYIFVGSRIWHCAGSCSVQDQYLDQCFYCTGKGTRSVSSSVYDAYINTRSAYRASPDPSDPPGVEYYTSVWPAGVMSCARYWWSGQRC
jgi:hypothetical protein